jgi:hypothetical protein
MKWNTLVWVTDGSYDWKEAADSCRVSWIIFCTKTGLRLPGTFWKRSPTASSYQAEMLDLCALHLLARAFSEFYEIREWQATLCCNNKGALELSFYHQRRVTPSVKCVGNQHSPKVTKHTFTGKFLYSHVHGHMDKYLFLHQLFLFQKLNCACNMLSKSTVTTAMIEGYYNRPTQLLPKEDVAGIIWGNKVTDNISHSIRFHARIEVTRKYLGNEKKKPWPNNRFDKIDWEHLDLLLKKSPTCKKSGDPSKTWAFAGPGHK